ncbi:MAG: Metal-dependent hydrolase YbeY, involved in rRNA and/or ribosome maturation and assembly [uncultured Campylobacterales bacterium]|uniref:Endoribonuclease YbeY n=1 Tax=uncultured Campylobacterales bacterium TaxID=352960 RepID=A0A6S6SWS2_9BACT|nr:MAG: Metal-dependent hydrolase YbeY, involved in rRNA and/or ribosome maturation and assembly [uncultured Campylobacterales bacterium]
MIEIDNLTDFEIEVEFLEKISNYFANSKDIELIVCNSEYIKDLNKKHRKKDKSTDVLSFGIQDFLVLGSIVINIDEVKSKASFYKHSFYNEFCLLFIHGLLHLLGYDHEKDFGEMRNKEEEIIKHFDLPTSLIVRQV